MAKNYETGTVTVEVELAAALLIALLLDFLRLLLVQLRQFISRAAFRRQ